MRVFPYNLQVVHNSVQEKDRKKRNVCQRSFLSMFCNIHSSVINSTQEQDAEHGIDILSGAGTLPVLAHGHYIPHLVVEKPPRGFYTHGDSFPLPKPSKMLMIVMVISSRYMRLNCSSEPFCL